MTDTPQLPGERLREERKRQNLTERETADKLHLSVSYLRALEADDYEHLPEPTFVKGYLRNYARLLGLPADELVSAFDALHEPVPAPVVAQENAPLVTRQAATLAMVVLVLVAILLGWWLSADTDSEKAVTTVDAPAVTVGAGQVEAQEPPVQEQAPEQLPAGEAEPADAAASAPAPVTEPQLQSAELKVMFSADCWVEVTDASGKSLFKGARSANTSLTLTGQAPFQVMLGNAAGVTSLSVDGKQVELPKAAAGEVVHLQAQ